VFGQHKRGLIPDVWLQDPKYFGEWPDELRSFFGHELKPNPRPEVGVHVRRGDYLWQPMFVSLSETDYYERAMALFPDEKFLIFSDDPDWCRIKWPQHQVMSGQTELQDLNMMANCKSNIIANSSFSWWAAYLNTNPSKRVIYPKQWHTDGVSRIGFPNGWEAC
jgi:hypothetical protein